MLRRMIVACGAFLFVLGAFPATYATTVDQAFRASIIMTLGLNGQQVGTCSGFVGEMNGSKWIVTASHCCISEMNTPNATPIDSLVITGELKGNTINASLSSVDKVIEVDPQGYDICRIPLPPPMSSWNSVSIEAEPLDNSGEKSFLRVLHISRLLPEEKKDRFMRAGVCPAMGGHELWYPPSSPRDREQVISGAVCPGQSGSIVYEPISQKVIGVATASTVQIKPGNSSVKIRRTDASFYSPFTYTGWFLDKLLKKSFPKLPK